MSSLFERDLIELGKYFGVASMDSKLTFLEKMGAAQGIEDFEKVAAALKDDPIQSLISRLQREDMLGLSVVGMIEIINNLTTGTTGTQTSGQVLLRNKLMITAEEKFGAEKEKPAFNTCLDYKKKSANGYFQGTIDYPGYPKAELASIRDLLGKGGKTAAGAGTINSSPQDPTRAAPNVSVIQVWDARDGPTSVSTGAVQVFMNSIPALELSRCVPFLDVTIVQNHPPLDSDGNMQSISLLRSLTGGEKVVKGAHPSNFQLATAVDINVLDKIRQQDRVLLTAGPQGAARSEATDLGFGFATAGMEMFLMPQTLVPMNTSRDWSGGAYTSPHGNATAAGDSVPPAGGSGRPVPILDRFRPLASIEEFSVNVKYTFGFLTFKTAELQLVIHDRSRLHEVSHLVRPDTIGKVKLMIEYGWSHAAGNDPTSNNFFARFLNGLRVREMFNVINSKYQFEQDGSVRVTLKLSTSGGTSMGAVTIPEGDVASSARHSMELVIEIVAGLRKTLLGKNSSAKSLNSSSFLNSVVSSESALSMDKETSKKLRSFLISTKGTGSADYKELKKQLKKLYGAGAKTGLKKKFVDAVSTQISDKISYITQSTPDPFLTSIKDPSHLDSGGFIYPDVRAEVRNYQRNYVSLGKLLTIFVAQPLAGAGIFEEIQLIFYSFNPKATWVRDFNMAQFPIPVQAFKKKFTKFASSGLNMSVAKFLGFLRKEFVSTPSANAYGFGNMYTAKDDGYSVKKAFEDATILSNENQRRMAAAYSGTTDSSEEDLEFKLPRMEFKIEALPMQMRFEDSSTQPGDNPKTLLRIHIYDAQNSTNPSVDSILKSSFEDTMGYIGKAASGIPRDPQQIDNNHRKNFAEGLRRALKADIIEPVGSEVKLDGKPVDILAARYKLKGSFYNVKSFVAYNMPTIDIGSSHSAVIDASLDTQNNPLLATISMQRAQAGKSGTQAPGASMSAGIPMQINPTTVKLETYGNPFFTMAQEFFIDFNTGTSADNVYRVSGLTHRISPQEFKSSVSLINLEAYGVYRATLQNVEDALTAIADIEEGTS